MVSFVTKLMAVSFPVQGFLGGGIFGYPSAFLPTYDEATDTGAKGGYHRHSKDGEGSQAYFPYSAHQYQPGYDLTFKLPKHNDALSKERHMHFYNDGIHYHDGHHHEANSYLQGGGILGVSSLNPAYSPINYLPHVGNFLGGALGGLSGGLGGLLGFHEKYFGNKQAKNEVLANYGGPPPGAHLPLGPVAPYGAPLPLGPVAPYSAPGYSYSAQSVQQFATAR